MLNSIVIVNDFAHINGGAGQVALTSAIRLANEGYDVTLFSAVEPRMPELEVARVKVIVTGQYEILNDPNRLRAAAQGIWNFKAQRLMDDLLRTLDPASTIVHVHSWTKALSASIIQIVTSLKIEVICTLHDYFAACPNGGFFDYQRQEICREVPLSFGCISRNCDIRNYSQKLWRVSRHIVQKKIGKVPTDIKYFITVSNFSEAIIKPFLPIDSTVFRVENPIHVEHHNRVEVNANDAFTFVGRLSPEKGVIMFAAAARRLGLVPVFVGEGKSRQEIEAICPAAQITGWVTGKQVVNHLSAARALVLPSILYETQGMVVAEAAALGVPSIVPDSCAARDMVEDGLTGLWFRGGDETDLIEKLRILQDPEVAARLGRAAYDAYWKSPSTIAVHIKKLISCYNTILQMRIDRVQTNQ